MAKKPGHSNIFIVIIIAALLAITVTIQYFHEISESKKEFHRELHFQASKLTENVNHKMMMFYQGLRIIARMPAVRNIGSYSDTFDKQSLWSLQELYSNLHANIDVSEVYIIPHNFDPDKIDVRTGKPFEPLVVFDNEIIGGELIGEESYEYRQMFQQLQWMKKNVPTDKGFSDLAYPAVFGEEVITCDDRHLIPGNIIDDDRSGLIYYVPFYSNGGEFKGVVVGIILSKVIRDFLPNENFVLRNKAADYTVEPKKSGAWKDSAKWVAKGMPDPNLIYSEVLPLKIKDQKGSWFIWGGAPNEVFWNLPAVKTQKHLAIAAYLMIILVTVTLIGNFRKQRLITEKNLELGKEIEDRQEAQRTVEQYGAHLDTIFNSVIDGIITCDENGIIEVCNPATEAIFEYEKSELIGKNVSVLMPESENKQHDIFMWGFKNNGAEAAGGQNRQLHGQRSDGRIFPLELTVNSASAGGKKLFVVVLRDVTLREMAARELANARDEALESLRLKSELLANVSHELRTPMNGIMGCADLLKETTLDEEQASYLKILSDSSSGLVTIMDDLMDFSRLDSDKLVLNVNRFGICESVDSAVHLLFGTASEKGLDLKVEYADGLPEIVYGDNNRLRQVLTNLIGNSIKFTGQGGITVRVYPMDPDERGQIVCFEVSDTGIGISEEHHKEIFDSFVQADGSITREHGGMGLGLAICNRLVHAMHGEIGLNSKPGEGTTFWFWVPFGSEDPRKNVA